MNPRLDGFRQAASAVVSKTLLLIAIFGTATAVASAQSYEIEVAHDDELFIINGEKYEAKTYCLGWEEGDEVVFVEGSPYGACATAVLYNKTKRDACEVWCE